MPIYEYVCRNCGDEIEKLQAMADAPLTDCSACGEAALKRKVSAPGFRLAGSGWYETDFKKDGRRHIAGDSNNSTESSGKSAEGSESKSESKSSDQSSGSGDKGTSQGKSASTG